MRLPAVVGRDAGLVAQRLCETIFIHTLSHMRTTIDINDELLRAVKTYAAGERKTLKEIFERALREYLESPGLGTSEIPPIPSFHGHGLQPGVDLTDNSALEALMNAEP